MPATSRPNGQPVRRRNRAGRVLVVRRQVVEQPEPPAGRFRAAAIARGLIPAIATAALGTFCVDTADRVVALTYDDGPDPEHTPRVLDTLTRHGATATFFVLSDAARRHPQITRRIVDDGHELALHGRNHRSLLTMSDRAAVAEIRAARAVVEDIAGIGLRSYRPPYGAHTLRQALGIRRLGLDLVIWSGDAHDWVHGSEEAIAGRALAAVFPGSIVLLHDTRADPETIGADEELPHFDRADVLERILTGTRQREFRTLTARRLVEHYPRVTTIARERMTRP